MSDTAIPVLDLQDTDRDHLSIAYKNACIHHGFVFLTNYQRFITDEVIQTFTEFQKRFFSLPEELKMEILADDNNRGFTPMYEEDLDPEHSKKGRGDAKEGLYFGREVPLTDTDASKPLHGPNQWPDENKIPLLKGYRHAVEAYQRGLTQLGMEMLFIVATSLSLPVDFFLPFFQKPMTFVRPLHYAPIQSNESGGEFAAGAHSDYGFLTILWTDGGDGLQIHYKDEWIDVNRPPGAFIVNIGDMQERWTAGLFKSTLHRVVNPTGRERYSTAFFFEPSFDAVVVPVVGGDEAKAAYPPVTSGQYLLSKYASTHSGFDATSALALENEKE